MNEKELKKLSRKQLLELLLKQTENSEKLQLQLEEMKNELEKRIMMEKKAGSIAEAALQLNGIFETAQAAADQYLENIRYVQGNSINRQKKIDDEYIKAVRNMFAEAKKRCEFYEEEQKKRADQIVAEANHTLTEAERVAAESENRARKHELESERVLKEVRRLYKYLNKKTDLE